MKQDIQQEEIDNLKALFTKLKNEQGINRSEFARRFEIPGKSAMIHQHLIGARPISLSQAFAYAKGFGCKLEDISPRLAKEAQKTASMLEDSSHNKPENASNNHVTKGDLIRLNYDPTSKKVPLISWIQASQLSDITNIDCSQAEKWVACPVMHSDKTYALRVMNLAMFNPDPSARHSFRDGETIFIDPEKPAENNAYVVVKLSSKSEVTFRQLMIDGKDRFLRAINPEWPKKIITLDDKDLICGTVICKWTEI